MIETGDTNEPTIARVNFGLGASYTPEIQA
jgi:hypothetical protein